MKTEEIDLINEHKSPLFFETTFVLFFLSLDLGQNLTSFGFDIAFLALTVIAVAVLPYFLPSAGHSSLGSWISGRAAISGFGIVSGLVFSQLLGGLLPSALAILPLSLATIAAVVASVAMFSGFFNPRYAEID